MGVGGLVWGQGGAWSGLAWLVGAGADGVAVACGVRACVHAGRGGRMALWGDGGVVRGREGVGRSAKIGMRKAACSWPLPAVR